MNSGIYKIMNKINNRYYVGSTKNFKSRKQRHFQGLRKGMHINKALQNAWNKYGEQNFEFIIIENVDEDNLLIVEQKYLDIAKLDSKSYNFSWNSTAPMTGKKLTEEQKKKIGISHKGKIVSKQTKEKIRNSRLGTTKSDAEKIKVSGENNPRHKLTNEIVDELRELYSKPKVTMMKLSKKYNVSFRKIRDLIRNNKPIFGEIIDKQIKQEYVDQPPTKRQSALKLGVRWDTVNNVVNGSSWRYV